MLSNYRQYITNHTLPGKDLDHPAQAVVPIDQDGYLIGTSGNPIYVINKEPFPNIEDRSLYVQSHIHLDDATETILFPSGGPGTYLDLTYFQIDTDIVYASGMFLHVRDKLGGNPTMDHWLPAAKNSQSVANSLQSDNIITFTVPFLQSLPNQCWTVQLDGTPTSGAVHVIAQARKNF